MATIANPEKDFARLPDPDPEVFTAPLTRPDHVGEDWIEPAQREYDGEDDAIWNDLFDARWTFFRAVPVPPS